VLGHPHAGPLLLQYLPRRGQGRHQHRHEGGQRVLVRTTKPWADPVVGSVAPVLVRGATLVGCTGQAAPVRRP
jgi:hypothetical protein